VKRIALALLAIPCGLVLVCLPVWAYGYYKSLDFSERIPPPGRLIDIGTHRLHIDCSRQGAPTVILEEGGGSMSASWAAVRTRLPDDMRVCAYDRAGMGWSDAGPTPRNVDTITSELGLLLEKAGEKPPYIFVGQSYGGTIGFTFVEQNLDNIAGFVAVEAPTYAFMKYRHESRFILNGTSRKLAAPFMTVLMTVGFRLAASMDDSQNQRYPAYGQAAMRDAGVQAKMASTKIKEDAYVSDLEPVMAYGSIPVVVVQGAASHLASKEWDKNSQDLLATSTNSRLMVVDSANHGVNTQAPEAIVEAIDWVRNNTINMESHANHLE
jgi:pimeloyl-ACP methyl ester carboxylesterase